MLLGLTVIVFSMMHLHPGRPGGGDPGPVRRAARRPWRGCGSQLGLDLPLHVQYAQYLGGLLHGDLGSSLFTYRPVTEIIGQNLPSTMELAVAAMALAIVLGLLLGILAAVYQDSWIDNLTMTLAVVSISHARLLAGACC